MKEEMKARRQRRNKSQWLLRGVWLGSRLWVLSAKTEREGACVELGVRDWHSHVILSETHLADCRLLWTSSPQMVFPPGCSPQHKIPLTTQGLTLGRSQEQCCPSPRTQIGCEEPSGDVQTQKPIREEADTSGCVK